MFPQVNVQYNDMIAPRPGFEPGTSALTAPRSTTELSRNKKPPVWRIVLYI